MRVNIKMSIIQKPGGKNITIRHVTIYDAIYKSLNLINTKITHPITLSKISNNPNVQKILLTKGLIREVKPKENLISEYQNYKYFVIAPKGHEYIKRFEKLRELVE